MQMKETGPSEPLAALIRTAKRAVEKIGEDFKDPADDWVPVMGIHAGEEVTIVGLFAPEGMDHPMNSPEGKDALAAWMTPQLREMGAEAVAFVTSAWTRRYEKDEAPAELPRSIADDPERSECVMIQGIDRGAVQVWTAEIKRFPDRPPQLGEWEEITGGEGQYEGRFLQAIARGLRPQG